VRDGVADKEGVFDIVAKEEEDAEGEGRSMRESE
jgi:hypothetical protein